VGIDILKGEKHLIVQKTFEVMKITFGRLIAKVLFMYPRKAGTICYFDQYRPV
jgi:hypothetical protein